MALNIKDAETDRRALAAETGLSITEALRMAVGAQLETLRQILGSRQGLDAARDLSQTDVQAVLHGSANVGG